MSVTALYRKLSISTKLITLVAAIVLLCVVILSLLSASSLYKITDEQIQSAERELSKTVLQSMQLTGENVANKVQALIDRSFVVPLSVANMLSDSATPNDAFSRPKVKELVRSALAANPQISSMYAQFEANGYDGRDNEFKANLQHSSDEGALEIYWLRENGSLTYSPVEEAAEKYLAEKDENGIREAEWYLCSYDSKQPCALDPYLYEIEPGKSAMMTSLSAPVMVKGQFRGLVGIDINLPVLQQWIDKQSKSFYDGKSHLTLVSQRQLLVASSQFPANLGQTLAKQSAKLKSILDSPQNVVQESDAWYVKVPVTIKDAKVEWQLLVTVPTEVALAPLQEIDQLANQTLDSELTQNAWVALLMLGSAIVLVYLMARTISSPIEQVADSIEKLASNEGDLTQAVNISNHLELIHVSEGLNQFLEKLRDMITALKQQAQNLSTQVVALDSKANSMRQSTDVQETNLEDVVAAITEMATAANSVSALADDTAQNSKNSVKLLHTTEQTFRANVDEVTELSRQMQSSEQQISQVANKTNDITSIVSTIQAIAEQTNLLALNAAIEAARAGEQGRGFAVVADEVRSLASRTQKSTQEISALISNLQTEVNIAVSSLGQIQQSVAATVDKTQGIFSQLSEVVNSITNINDSAAQVASAANEQSQVSEHINQRIVAIGDGSKKLTVLGDEIEDLSQQVNKIVTLMNQQLGRLKS